tara:strand:+ start:2760 stop:2963 length:204 start_codon:yes stop_codon:yes gene_type:complete
MKKFNVQDRVVLDEMISLFRDTLDENYTEMKGLNKTPIITRDYWEYMIGEVVIKLDGHTSKRALKLR